MADDRVVAEIVSAFFLNTCPPRRPFNSDVLAAFMHSLSILNVSPRNYIPLSTGSVAEFSIEPMLPCVGDVDIMVHRSNELAIPQGHRLPAKVPAEFYGRVSVCEIIDDSEFPGYVYLERSYLLTEITDDGNYNASPCQREYVVGLHIEKLQGPAVVTKYPVVRPLYVSGSLSSSDMVLCVRCLSWPSQAADWPTRHRNYCWPDSETLDRVVSNGCDVVFVAHRLCRQDEWMRKHQFRLSFSRAEIILLNSWMRIQQIVYHMLRSFMKAESLTDVTDCTRSKILSNYNIKTLILWACEMKGRSWWIDELNVVGICVNLLHVLADWVTDARCPHYFINNCNLFDFLDISYLTQHMSNGLKSLTEVWLAEWFVNNYIRTCVGLCPEVLRVFRDISTHVKLQNAVSAVIDWRLRWTPNFDWIHFSVARHIIHNQQYSLYYRSPSVQTCLYFMTEVSKIDERLTVYFAAGTFLYAAVITNRNPVTGEMLDILSTVCLRSNDVRLCHSARDSSVLSVIQAERLMKVVTNTSRSTMQLIEIELSKAYLYRALRCKDSDSDCIYCLANVYLAVLYYTTGQFQQAIGHCTVVMRSHDHSQCRSHVVQGDLLPKIDDDLDSALGLTVFYQYIRTAALNQQQETQYVSVFSTELFAHFLHIRCQSVVKCHQFTQYKKCFSESSHMFVTDAIVFDSVRRRICPTQGTKPMSSGEQTKPELVELLQKSAVENLTICRHLEAREFGSVLKIVTTDFEALYAYKRCKYQRCLQLSTQNVHTLVGVGLHSMSHVASSQFIQLMDDDDLVCLTGLTLLVDPSCRDLKLVSVSQLSLSLYLMTQCQMKLRHPTTSLAQTLDYIEVARRESISQRYTLDQLVLKLTEHKLLGYISN